MGEAVKVVVRSRPMNRREITLGCKNVIFMDSDLSACQIVNPADNTAPPKVFTFDGVYDEHSSTEDIYNEIAYPLIEGALEGYNSTIFAYGQTGCGKSFTMQGIPEPSAQRGIIPRSFEHIFEAISVAEGTKYLVLASYLEIYNEEIRDLLGNDIKRKLELKEHADKGVYVQDLSLHPVQCISDCEKLMKKGWQNRATASTLMNTDSSRSHSIFSMHLEMMPYNGFECDLQVSDAIKKGKLNLVDLAGSERQAKTGATGDRLKEASKINLSLSALGNVISALVDGRSKHIPYRDSKLTRLLQDSLGGNTKTLMVACLSPADNNYDETLSTLRFANRAKNIKNKPRINQDPKDTMISEYQEEIKKLKQLLESSTVVRGYQNVTDNVLQEEKEKVRSEYEIQMEELRRKCEDERTHKYQLQLEMENLRKHYEDQIGRINAQAGIRNTDVTVGNGIPSSSSITTATVNNEAVIGGNELTFSAAHQEVLMRLQKLKKSMVGGERAHDKELKEKRQWKKKVSERRLQALANVLAKVDDEEGLMLKVYDDIQQELDAKTELLKRNKIKIRGLENEISDIQSEFEKERTDYLETIRKLSCELKLYQQISEKIVPTLRKECNYSDIEHIKSEAIWNEDTQHWKLPDLIVTRTKLPPTGFQPNGLTFRSSSAAQTSPKSSRSSGSCHSSPPQTVLSSPDIPEDDIKSVQLKQGTNDEGGNIAVNYFKPKRATELLNRAKVESSRAFNTWKDYKNRKKGSSSNEINNISNSMVNANGIHSSTGDLPLYAALKGSNVLNSSWGGDIGWIGSGLNLSPELNKRRPARLEALPVVHKKNSTS